MHACHCRFLFSITKALTGTSAEKLLWMVGSSKHDTIKSATGLEARARKLEEDRKHNKGQFGNSASHRI